MAEESLMTVKLDLDRNEVKRFRALYPTMSLAYVVNSVLRHFNDSVDKSIDELSKLGAMALRSELIGEDNGIPEA